jgi:hypothetical protein
MNARQTETTPASIQGQALSPDEGWASSMSDRLLLMIEELSTRPAIASAARAAILRIAVHPKQRVDGASVYVELSPGYVARVAGVSRETARQAWQAISALGAWRAIPLAAVRELGLRIRRLGEGAKWGQHLLVKDGVVRAAELVAERLGLRRPVPSEALGEGWEELDAPERRGSRLVVRCPYHDDEHPSMILNSNQDERTGWGVCLACRRPDGSRTSLAWIRTDDGRLLGRLSLRARSIPSSEIGEVEGGEKRSSTIDNPSGGARDPSPSPLDLLPSWSRSTRPERIRARYLLGRRFGDAACVDPVAGTVDRVGFARRESASEDLLEVLRRADREAATDRTAHTAELAAYELATASREQERDPRALLPDLYVSIDRSVPAAWTEIPLRSGRVVRTPSAWRPVVVEWVGVDLDGFEDGPIGNASLALAGRRLEALARTSTALSGRVAVVRTSHRGVQALFELAAPSFRPERFHADPSVRALLRALDRASLDEVRAAGFEGGHADPSVHAPGRYVRRPGARFAKDGAPYVARLAFASED